MGSSEPSLVPEWLRNNGHGNSGGTAVHHIASANTHSDTPLLANSARNRQSRNITEIDNPRANLDRSSSINSRRTSSNNGSTKHPYSSFSKSHREKEREKDKDRSGFVDFWEHNSFDPLPQNALSSRSMVSRKQGDLLPHRVGLHTKGAVSNNHLNRNGLATGDKSPISVPKVSFENDFPSLGADEKQGVPNVARVASPGLTIAAQGLPFGSLPLVGEGWSALAEVPVVKGINCSALHQPLATSAALCNASSVLNATSETSNTNSVVLNTASAISNVTSGSPKTAGASCSASGLNMAEALVQPPSTRTAPLISVENQRLELLAIKKVRQLVPKTSAMPKATNSSGKLKPKLLARAGDINGVTKAGQQSSSSSLNVLGQSPRGGPVTPDASKQSHGSKLLILKPPWENVASATLKDGGSNLENSAGGILTNNSPATPAMSSAPVRTPKAIMERKAVLSSFSMASAVEKRPLSSHAQSRSDFFNSVRKKTLMTATTTSGMSSSIQSPSEEKACESSKEMTFPGLCGTVNVGLTSKDFSNNEDHKFSVGENSSIPCAEAIPDEEEAAFLRSLGWEENCEEEEGLTEEEINSFLQEFKKLSPSLNLSQGAQPTLSLLVGSHASNVGVASPRVSSSDAALKSN
uniref:Uncharacterized protein n=1 Tax=Kalanchoe fedtschenkoi TaxID=63787 RepID=A0A7N0TK66_KALFE